MSTYTNINDFQTFSSPMPFQHFLGNYALTTTNISSTPETAEQCNARCANTPNCEVWKRTATGTCTTHAAIGTNQSGIKINTATRFIAGSSAVYSSVNIPLTTAMPTGSTGSSTIPNGTSLMCETRCNNIAACGAYSFDATNAALPMCNLYATTGGVAGNVGVSRDMFSDSTSYITLNSIVATTTSRTTLAISGSTSVTTNIQVLIDGNVKATITPSQLTAAGGITITFSAPPIDPGQRTIQLQSSSVMSNSRTFMVTLPTLTTNTVAPKQTGAATLTTSNRTFVTVVLAYAGSTPTDTFAVSVRNGSYKKSLGNMTFSQINNAISGIDIGSECTGGANYILDYTMTGQTTISSPSFSILYRLNGLTSGARGIYSTKIVASTGVNLFRVIDTTSNSQKDVISDPFGRYMFSGTTTEVQLTNFRVVTWYSQSPVSSTVNLTAATGSEPTLKLNSGENFYYIDFGTGNKRFTLPSSVLSQVSGQILNIHTNIKRFTPGSKVNTILFGSGSSTALRGGVWVGIVNANNRYMTHRGTQNTNNTTSINVSKAISDTQSFSASTRKENWSIPFTTTVANIYMNGRLDVTSDNSTFLGSSVYTSALAIAANNGIVGGSSYANNTNLDNFDGGLDAIYVHSTAAAFSTPQYDAINLHSS